MPEPYDSKIHFFTESGKNTLIFDNLPMPFAIRIDWTDKVYNAHNKENSMLDDRNIIEQINQNQDNSP
ncbi:MAG: hypothetical protein ACTSWC_09165, partial [Promethearchaeota archaeon]